MTIHYNVTGPERKRLTEYISGFMGTEKKYLGAPTFAYQIGYINISKDGAVSFEDRACNPDIDALMSELEAEGFHTEDTIAKPDGTKDSAQSVEVQASAEDTTEPVEAQASTEDPAEPVEAETCANGLTIQMPTASFTQEALTNLRNLVAAKGKLLCKALGTVDLPVEVGSDTVSFPWFSGGATGEEVKAYTHLVTALCDMARTQKRITAKEKETNNEKYAFRCFLLRLGFIGPEFKEERKILLRNLSGNSAFKSGTKRTTEVLQPEPPNSAMRVAVEGDPALAEALADAMLIEQVNASFGGENDAVSA